MSEKDDKDCDRNDGGMGWPHAAVLITIVLAIFIYAVGLRSIAMLIHGGCPP